jgi:glycosyltransferase involved in cell wall biosynthesis
MHRTSNTDDSLSPRLGDEAAELLPGSPRPVLPVVTVLIDTYNYGHLLGRAIESALGQTYPSSHLEILVVDDGSTDHTPEVAQQYADRVRYTRKARGGQASAINEGIRQARGEIICLLDADDYFYPDKVRRVVEAFRGHPQVGLVYDNFDIVDNDGKTFRKHHWELTWTRRPVTVSKVPSQLQSLILLGHPWNCTTSAMSLRRSVVEGTQEGNAGHPPGVPLRVPEDVFLHSPDLFLSIVLPFMAEVRILPSPLTAYVFHGQNVGLYRSLRLNREMHKQQVAYVRRYVQDRFGKRFVTYLGRSVYGPEADAGWQKSRVLCRL